jgi:hypothetical protein
MSVLGRPDIPKGCTLPMGHTGVTPEDRIFFVFERCIKAPFAEIAKENVNLARDVITYSCSWHSMN